MAAKRNEIKILDQAVKESNSIGDVHRKFRRAFIVNCWHINEGESDAMWRLYFKTNEGVAIQSSIKSLTSSLKDYGEEIYLSKVRYLNFEKDVWYHPEVYPVKNYNLFTPIIHKRNSFEHENELRIFQQLDDAVDNERYWEGKQNQLGKFIPVDINTLIDKIILPPTSDSSVRKKVTELLEKYRLAKVIEKSKLDDEPYF
jgi:hypothetical protein